MRLRSRLADLFLPRRCPACDRRLQKRERSLCVGCALSMPRYDVLPYDDNSIVHRFWGVLPMQRGAAFFLFERENTVSHLVHALKYNGRYDACRSLMADYVSHYLERDFFDEIDVIVPIPLHRNRAKQRGYNQAEYLAMGVSQVTGIPLCTDWLWRHVDNPSQTQLTGAQRRQNVQGIFALQVERCPHAKHVLLVDDVLTTGATMQSAMDTIHAACTDVVFSVLTLSAVQPL